MIVYSGLPVVFAMLLPRRIFGALTTGWALGAGALGVLIFTVTAYPKYVSQPVVDANLIAPAIVAFTIVAILVTGVIDLYRSGKRATAG